MTGLRIARYLRVSNKEQAKTLERQLFSLEKVVLKLGGRLEDSPLFKDVQSGRDNDRIEFQKLYRAIETRAVDIVVVYRLDRLAREWGMSARLGELFEKTGVRLYDFQKDDFVDFSNPEEWESYAQRAVAAEAESRKMSRRIRSGYEFSRHKGKASGKPAWGYLKDPETEKYILNPQLADAVRGAIATVLETKNFQASCRIIAEKWGKQWSSNSLRKWICNPVLRGHTGYLLTGRHWREVRYNTHPEFAVLTESQFKEIESLIEDRRHYWGANSYSTFRHPLSGMVRCGKCGTTMAITKGYVSQEGKPNFYFSCRERVQHVKPNVCDMKRSLRVEIAESAVIQKLIEAREAIADIAQTPETPAKDPRILELENLLNGLIKLGNNPALQASKDQLRSQIAALQTQQQGFDMTITENRSILLDVFESPSYFKSGLANIEKRAVFKKLVDEVTAIAIEVDTGQKSKRGKPKLLVHWNLDVKLKPLGI